MVEAGEPAWRGRQLAEALYRQLVTELDAVTTLPKALRQRLIAEGWQVGRPRIVQDFQSSDGTERYLVECQSRDDHGLVEVGAEMVETGLPGARSIAAGLVETVWMPEADGGEAGDGSEADPAVELGAEELGAKELRAEKVGAPSTLGAPSIPRFSAQWVGDHERLPNLIQKSAPDRQAAKPWTRATLCVSSQMGCAVNCRFCFTAQLGLQRNLTAGEIAGQVLAVFDRHGVQVGRDRVNLVFMGMGEPFLNYDNFMAAVRLLVEEVGLSPRRMTVSTSGIVPGIERFAREPAEVRPRLALSLNAPNDTLRGEIMPINRKWPIAALVDALRQVRLRPGERVTFEYVLLGGLTDRPEHAREVAHLVRRTGLPIKVNLIAWNPGPGIDLKQPLPEAVESFRQILADAAVPTYVRKPRGRDIFAACGQLKRTVESGT